MAIPMAPKMQTPEPPLVSLFYVSSAWYHTTNRGHKSAKEGHHMTARSGTLLRVEKRESKSVENKNK